MSDEARELMLVNLGKPFPPEAIKQRAGAKGRLFDYLATPTVIHRLNTVAGAWDFRINRVEFQEFPTKDRDGKAITGRVVIVAGTLTIPGLGSRDGIGIQRWDPASSEDLVKGGASDCLKKAATLFGVGLQLYGDDYEGGDAGTERQSAPAQPAAQPTGNGAATSTNGTDWLGEIEQAKGNATELAKIATRLHKAGIKRGSGHPAWQRLEPAMKEAQHAG